MKATLREEENLNWIRKSNMLKILIIASNFSINWLNLSKKANHVNLIKELHRKKGGKGHSLQKNN